MMANSSAIMKISQYVTYHKCGSTTTLTPKHSSSFLDPPPSPEPAIAVGLQPPPSALPRSRAAVAGSSKRCASSAAAYFNMAAFFSFASRSFSAVTFFFIPRSGTGADANWASFAPPCPFA